MGVIPERGEHDKKKKLLYNKYQQPFGHPRASTSASCAFSNSLGPSPWNLLTIWGDREQGNIIHVQTQIPGLLASHQVCHTMLHTPIMHLYKKIHQIIPNIFWLVVCLPLWKMMEFVSWDDEIPNIWKFIKHVPKHQPVLVSIIPYTSLYSSTIRDFEHCSMMIWHEINSQNKIQNLCPKVLPHDSSPSFRPSSRPGSTSGRWKNQSHPDSEPVEEVLFQKNIKKRKLWKQFSKENG